MKKTNIKISKFDGNTTALIMDEGYSIKQRALFSRRILKKFKHVEQVGFLDKKDKGVDYTLHMAGGEFCGNGIRIAGLLSYKEYREKEKVIKLNGKKFKVVIGKDDISLYVDKKDIVTKNDSVLIYNIIYFFNTQKKIKTPKNIMAEGYITYKKHNKYFDIEPYIHVKGVGSSIYERSCASGSIALAIHLFGNKIGEYLIRQPCGETYHIIIDKKFIILKSKLNSKYKTFYEEKM